MRYKFKKRCTLLKDPKHPTKKTLIDELEERLGIKLTGPNQDGYVYSCGIDEFEVVCDLSEDQEEMLYKIVEEHLPTDATLQELKEHELRLEIRKLIKMQSIKKEGKL